jgi:hypothetical protein
MTTKVTQMFGIEYPVFAFTHCRDVVREMIEGYVEAVARLQEQIEG